MKKTPLYNYEDDLDTFFRELAKPAGKANAAFTMNDVGGGMYAELSFVDMEGYSHGIDSFSNEQLALLRQYDNDGKHYQFLCYPDIPAPVMRVMAVYAELHPEPSTRIQLWKLGRSGILNPFIMDICCCVLDAGVNLADVIDIEETDMCLLELQKKQAELLGFSCDSIILKTFSRAGHDCREPVNNYISLLKKA